jgi:hypothetical protein
MSRRTRRTLGLAIAAAVTAVLVWVPAAAWAGISALPVD